MQTLKNRTCVFAGATGNIGRGAVKALAQGGMNVVMVTHSPDSAKEIMEEMKNCPGKVIAMSNDGGDHTVFGKIAKQFGSVDVIINSTGGLDAPLPAAELDPEILRRKLEHHITSAFLMAQAALPYLERSRNGRIIFTASAGAENGFIGENIADSIARGGVLTMTKALARELSKKSITVNCIARSGMIDDHEPHPGALAAADLHPLIPLGRLGTAEEYGALVAYLASEEAAFVTGQILHLSGGIVI